MHLFSSPIGESTFSTDEEYAIIKESGKNFRPLSGNLLSLRKTQTGSLQFAYFRPLSGNLLSLQVSKRWSVWLLDDFRPLSGNLLSLRWKHERNERILLIFVPYRGIYFLYPASRTPLFIRVPELFCGAKFKNCFSISISYACAAFSLILCGAAQNSFYCRENSILPIPISYNFP